MDVEVLTRVYLLYVVMPLWLAAGIADWLCHRAAHIATNSGWRESTIHLLMLTEIGVPVIMCLLLEINALVLAAMLVGFVAHEFTSHWDLRFALPRRHVSAAEQHIHNYLGVLPFMGLSFVGVLHWQQLFALFGAGPEAARFTIEAKRAPLPTAYIVVVLAATVILEILPYGEEWGHGWRRRPRPVGDPRAGGERN